MVKKTDAGRKERELGKKWLERIEAASKAERHWLDDAAAATAAFTGEGSRVESEANASGIAYDFNILYANVETIVPAVINSSPAPDIRRRFGNDDPVARDFAELNERAIRVQVDDSKLQVELEAMAQDAFLAGRGIIRLRFFGDVDGETTADELADEKAKAGGEQGKAVERAIPTVRNERIGFEAVSWRDYRHGPAKRWSDRPWEAFRHTIAPDDYDDFVDAELVGSQIEDGDSEREADKDCEAWEVWDRKSRTVIFIDSGTGKLLKRVADPLGLSGFFPVPTPVQPIELTGRLMPVNPFSIYRKLADELDRVTKRIAVITKQLKVKGWYGVNPADLQAVLDAEDNEFVPIKDAEVWAKNGGLQAAVLFWPVEKLILVLNDLYKQRDLTKQCIYEITGISDIVRGASKAQETAAAQQIKSQWGSLRIQKMQRMIERAARDLFVMMTEIIPTKFSPQTLTRMTDIQVEPTEQDLTPVVPKTRLDMPPEQMQAEQARAMEAEKVRAAKLQHLMQLKALMQEPVSAYYRVDVETDSTIRADLTQQKAEAQSFMTAASGYFAAVAPLVQQGAMPMAIAVEVFGSLSRLFNLGKTVEDAVDELVTMAKEKAGAPQQADPKAEAAASEQKRKAEDAAVDRQIKVEDAKVDRFIKSEAAKVDQAIKNTQLQYEQARLAMIQRQNFMQQYGAGSPL